MAELEALERALIAADKAGAADDARILAAEIKRLRGGDQQNADGTFGQPPSGMVLDPKTGAMVDTAAMAQRKFGGAGGQAIMAGARFASGFPIAGGLLERNAGMGDPIRQETANQAFQQFDRNNPVTSSALQIGGAIAGTIPAVTMAPEAFGMGGGSLLARSGASAATNSAISGADALTRSGGDPMAAVRGAGFGAVAGGLAPGMGALLGAGVRAVGDKFAGAGARVAKAFKADRSNTAVPLLSQADEATAQLNNQPLMNVDRGGETTRALLRSAANTNPEARAIFDKTTSDRFAGQGERAVDMLRRITNGQVDDLALQDQLRSAARAANKPAYNRAYQEGAVINMTPELERLTGSPAVVAAMRKVASETGRNRAIAEGYGAFNPAVNVTQDGRIMFARNAKPSGPPATSDLQFWDYVKRELDDAANSAARSGSRDSASSLGSLSRTLRAELDKQVPSYAQTRATAAAFFGAEDAIDAGKQFAKQSRNLPEMQKAFNAMKDAEKKAFRVGYASELIDKLKSTNDRVNAVRMFQSPEMREKLAMVFGKEAGQVEAFVHVENIMDRARGALGNSTTARQLAEMGLAGGATFGLTGDYRQGIAAALATGGARYASGRIQENTMKAIAQMLVSDDPQLIQRAIMNAQLSKTHMDALKAISTFAATLPTATATSLQ